MSLTLTLPTKSWQRIDLCSSSGDITVDESLQCLELSVVTASGDVEITSAHARNADLHTASGDITLTGDFETLSAGTASGDIETDHVHCNRADFGTASGDITARLFCDQLEIGTASGDVELSFPGQLPKTTTVGTASGDCSIQVPTNQGFHLNFETHSGEFHSDMPFSGIHSTKNVNLTYLTGSTCEINVSSSSGDFEIYTG